MRLFRVDTKPIKTKSLLALSTAASSPSSLSLEPWRTCALAALHVRLQLPAFVAGALDAVLVLLAPLAALEVLGAEALDLAGLVVGPELHA